MKQYAASVCTFVASLILLIALCVLSCSAKMTKYLLEKQNDIIFSRGVEGLADTEKIIDEDFRKKVDEACIEAYDSLTDTYYRNHINVSEDEAVDIYRKTTLNILRKKYEVDLSLRQPEIKSGKLEVTDLTAPELVLRDNQITLKNVTVTFTYGDMYEEKNTFEVTSELKNIVFYDENADIFQYSLIAAKGIYVTGKTSTIMGNIYAGVHEPAELRKAEALYGENGYYGGLNIMSTQVAIFADKIVSEGDVNMKGAFVVFGSEEQPVTMYAKNVTQTDVIAAKNIYALFGTAKDEDISQDQGKITEALAKSGEIEHYYDSDNDKTYVGTYRKIISSTDVTVKNDVTGIIITPGSVIVEEGVNIEGLIICGDRIYIQGNNNIVSSVEVLRKMLREELEGNIYAADDSDTIEEQSRNRLHLYMKDYLGGITYRGIEK